MLPLLVHELACEHEFVGLTGARGDDLVGQRLDRRPRALRIGDQKRPDIFALNIENYFFFFDYVIQYACNFF